MEIIVLPKAQKVAGTDFIERVDDVRKFRGWASLVDQIEKSAPERRRVRHCSVAVHAENAGLKRLVAQAHAVAVARALDKLDEIGEIAWQMVGR